jgi:hypothetical protein
MCVNNEIANFHGTIKTTNENYLLSEMKVKKLEEELHVA